MCYIQCTLLPALIPKVAISKSRGSKLTNMDEFEHTGLVHRAKILNEKPSIHSIFLVNPSTTATSFSIATR